MKEVPHHKGVFMANRHMPTRSPLAILYLVTLSGVLFVSPETGRAQPATFEWVRQAGGLSDDYGSAIAGDTAGSIFVTGLFNVGPASFDGITLTNASGNFVAKYDSTGSVLWVRAIGGGGADGPRNGIAVDPAGNCYVTGFFWDSASFDKIILRSSGSANMFIAKYDSAGNILWARQAMGVGFSAGQAIAVDDLGNAFVTGSFGQASILFGDIVLTTTRGSEMFLAKYDSEGNFLWARQSQEPGPGNGVSAWALSVSASGNCVVTGPFHGTATFGTTTVSSATGAEVFVTKYSSKGDLVWVRQPGGPTFGLASGTNEECFLTGYCGTPATFGNVTVTNNGAFFIAKMSGGGDFLWAQKGGAAGEEGEGHAIAVDQSNNAFVTGDFSGNFTLGATTLTNSYTAQQTFVARYDGNGVALWAVQTGKLEYGSVGYGIAVDSGQSCYITGAFDGTADFGSTNLVSATAGGLDIFIAKLPKRVPPLITSQPVDQTVVAGVDVTFAVEVTSPFALSFQWQKDGSNLPGETNSALLVPDVQGAEAGSYAVLISNLEATVLSRRAILVVNYSLVVNIAGDGTVEATPPGPFYPPDSAAMLKCIPAQAFEFSGWSGDVAGIANPLTILMNSNRVVTANFRQAPHLVIRRLVSQASSTSFVITFTGAVGSNYWIEASSDLQQWTPLIGVAAPAGDLQIFDPAAPNFKQRFYRVLSASP